MEVTKIGARFAAASLSVCLAVFAATAVNAATPVTTADEGGGVHCANCGPQPHQTDTDTGGSTGGSASNNPDGSGSSFDMTYGNLPDDGQTYTGSMMTQVVLPDGSVSVQTWPISWTAVGGSGYATGWNNASIPLGGSASISINASAPNGASYSAGHLVNNFGK